ncbi:translocation/assembly module TamB domain-containing protein [Pararhizobium sp. IMCC21322]|uniref:translocation/assembly module TamB domain-containing protein n=1 Tax=Pararhizobium sp. IMCC21322 TaxID=3067903 RepID=UPI0027421903|nr:translocation/assembly module TamB domain-containing protein [Pararhizobium sp. IMCC21322]
MRPLLFLLAVTILMVGLASPAVAQEEQEKSTFVEFVEGQLSTPSRQIRLNGLEGSLSSNVSFDSITIADQAGVWLEIIKPVLIWNRTALFRGRLEVESLEAERIDFKRKALADESLPSPEAGSFAIPDLPVAIELEKLSVPVIAFGPTVFGLETEASLNGAITLDEGSLDLNLDIQRLDGSGGRFMIAADYRSGDRTLALDVDLQEPENGIIATLLRLENKPPVGLKITGDAPLEDLVVSLDFNVAARPILQGQLTFDDTAAGLQTIATLQGPLSDILPETTRPFFGTRSNLTFDALFAPQGNVVINQLEIDSGSVQLAANAATLADGFLSRLNMDLSLAPTGDARLELPFGTTTSTIAGASLTIAYDVSNSEDWRSDLRMSDLQSADMNLDEVSFQAFGVVQNANDPTKRLVTHQFEGVLAGIAATKPALAQAIGTQISTRGSGEWSPAIGMKINDFSVTGETLSVKANGILSRGTFDGNIELETADLNAFSFLAGRKLGGATALTAQGNIVLIGGSFDLTLEGAGRSMQVDIEPVDNLLRGTTSLFGGVARTTEGLSFRNFEVSNDQAQLNLNGRFASEVADLTGKALIRNIASISPNGSGPLTLDLSLNGQQTPFNLMATLGLEEGMLSGKPVRDIALVFDGNTDGETLTGDLSGDGFIDRQRLTLAGRVDASEDVRSVTGLRLNIGATDIAGDLALNASGLIDADLSIQSRDIGPVAALGLVRASGEVNATIRLQPQVNETQTSGTGAKQTQSADIDMTARNVLFNDIRVGSADIKAKISELFRLPGIDGKISARSVVVSGFNVTSIDGTVSTSGDVTNFNLDAALADNNTSFSTAGQMARGEALSRITVNKFDLTSDIADARLTAPAELQLRDGTVQISNATLQVGDGSIELAGSSGSQMDIRVAINNLPLNIANAIVPDLALQGRVNGQVLITGSPDNPNASFTADGAGLSARPLADAGISPLQLNATGTFQNNVLVLNRAAANNDQGLNLTANGEISLAASSLAIDVAGNAPLSLVDPVLRDRGSRATGTATLDMQIRGSFQDPQIGGRLSVANGTFSDPLSNARLNNINLSASLSGSQAIIDNFSAALASGGTVSASGSVGIFGQSTSNLTIRLNEARYTDAQTFSTVLNGTLSLTGNLTSNPFLSGEINLGETEITVPESFASSAELLDVRHIMPPRIVRQTLARIERATPAPKPSARPFVLTLDVTINAPNRIFVRGRGLDAELGGRIRLTGPTFDIVPVGQFDLIRGRLSIVGQRIDLDEGRILMQGDLNPRINFLARVETEDVDAFIRIQGRLDDIEVTFTSSPSLPQDEVLSQIIFGRGVGELSPLQVARLASIALELTGGNSPGLVGSLRDGLGLDDIDIVSDSSGNTAVRVGKYINDNVYLGVEAGQETEATINLDITDDLTAKGSVSSDGNTGIGIFFEKDY